MAHPLLIHHREDFIHRIKAEAGSRAWITSSIDQGLLWINNTQMPISAIYINAADSRFSTLQILEKIATQRPVTPVYLIDDRNEISSKHLDELQKMSPIRASFNGNESFENLISPLNLNPHPSLQALQNRMTAQSEHSGYIAVPIIDFVNTKIFPLDVYVEDTMKQLRMFGAEGTEVPTEDLVTISKTSSWLFVSETKIQEMREKIRKTHENYSRADCLPIAWKSAESLYHAKTLLSEIRRGGASEILVEETHALLNQVYHLVAQLTENASSNEHFKDFMNQARQSDRAMSCAVLSILMCKALKFEKNAIVEILGIASFFQDIALYRSPFGNLTEAKPSDLADQALSYYEQHALIGADLLSHHTNIPEVTLQVIRQHHERKDRTGFPNRIGGMQLHPMAEILSLINAYLDLEDPSQNSEEIYGHFSERIVLAFKSLHNFLPNRGGLVVD